MKNNFGLDLIAAKEHGIPMEECMPVVTVARVIQIDSEQYKSESMDRRPHTTTSTQTVTFEIKIDKEKHTARQVFKTGDVVPDLGSYVRGVYVQNQFFSLMFVMTHELKVK